jgi:hypothetical protein
LGNFKKAKEKNQTVTFLNRAPKFLFGEGGGQGMKAQ